MNIIQNVNTREDLDRWVEEKLVQYNVKPAPDKKLHFLRGAKSSLDKPGPDRYSERTLHLLNLVNAEIVRLRAEMHCDPTLF